MVNRVKTKGGRKKSGFVYKPRSPDSVKKRSEQTGGMWDSVFKSNFDTYRAKGGDNTLRILPPTWDDPEHHSWDIWVHSWIGPNNGSYLCLSKNIDPETGMEMGKKCPICIAAKEARDVGEENEAKALRAKKQSVCWVLDRDEDEPNPSLYAMSWTMDRDIATLSQSKRTGKTLLIDHPEEGYDVTFKKSGAKLNTRYYGTQIDRDPTPICEDERDQDDVLEYIEDNPVPSTLLFRDAEFLTNILEGGSKEEEEELDEDDQDERPLRRRSRRTEEEEEEEEETKPRRGRGRKDEEEEEETKPRRGRGRKDEEEEEEVPLEQTSRRRRRREEEEENGEDEERSSRRSRRRREEEEEEEEPLTRRRMRRREEEDEGQEENGDAGEDDDTGENGDDDGNNGDGEDEDERRPARRASGRGSARGGRGSRRR